MIQQTEIAALFARHHSIEDALGAIHLRIIAGETVEQGRYSIEPEVSEPICYDASFGGAKLRIEDGEPEKMSDPPCLEAIESALPNCTRTHADAESAAAPSFNNTKHDDTSNGRTRPPKENRHA
jgi:hypothetical protein